MMRLAPHLLLRSDESCSHAAVLLGAAGYVVSKIDDDAIAERLAGSPHIDAVVVELSAGSAIRFGRRLEARYGRGTLLTVTITSARDSVRRALPTAAVLTPFEIENDLISTMDLALARWCA
jgi:hypothetical protein